MTYLVKKDVALDPMNIGLFGPLAVVTRAKGYGHLIEEFRFRRGGLLWMPAARGPYA
jgi:hypothetical protein